MRTDLIKNVPLDISDKKIKVNFESPYKIISAKRLNRRVKKGNQACVHISADCKGAPRCPRCGGEQHESLRDCPDANVSPIYYN